MDYIQCFKYFEKMKDLSVFYKDSPFFDEYKRITLCFLTRKNSEGVYEYLLGMHHKQQKWNGFGGKVGDKPEFKDETIEESLVREGLEEFGIRVLNPTKRAEMLFVFFDEKGKEQKVLCHLFFADTWEGEIKASSEMLTPTWFSLEKMPWSEMWPNDRIWLEEILKREGFLKAEFRFDDRNSLIASSKKMIWGKNNQIFLELFSSTPSLTNDSSICSVI